MCYAKMESEIEKYWGGKEEEEEEEIDRQVLMAVGFTGRRD